MAQVRMKRNHNVTGIANDFNQLSMSEVIVGFDNDGGRDSVSVFDLEVRIGNEWKPMDKAFIDRDLIPNNTNVWFGLPMNEQDRARGYFL